jgi:hypothetical protein
VACRSFALPGGDACLAHDPDRAETARAARSRGAVHANKLRAINGRRSRLETVPSLVAFTGRLIQDVMDGTTPAEIGRVVLYGISIQRHLVEVGELEQRVAALERRDAQGDRDQWRA